MTPCEHESCGDPRMRKLLDELWALHCKKAADYGSGDDPLANLRAVEDFGLPPVLGIALRMNDKMTRLKSFFKKKYLANESVRDGFIDLANYSLLALLFLDEEEQTTKEVLIEPSDR